MPTISLDVIRGFVTNVVQNCSSEQCIKGSLHTLPHSHRNPLIAHGRNGPSHTDHHEKHLSNVKSTSINPSAHSHGQFYPSQPDISKSPHFPISFLTSPLPSPYRLSPRHYSAPLPSPGSLRPSRAVFPPALFPRSPSVPLAPLSLPSLYSPLPSPYAVCSEFLVSHPPFSASPCFPLQAPSSSPQIPY